MTHKKIAIVAGETSGDILGASLMQALKVQYPDATFFGIPGPLMKAEGCEAFFDAEELAVFGLVEVLKHLPRLLKLRRQLVRRILEQQPDVFIGIDSPDFNLGLAKRLKNKGVPTIHYVCPSVWAWRQKRVHKIAKSVNHVLCLLPFEQSFLKQYNIPSTFVGHPLADEIPLSLDKTSHREQLNLHAERPVLAVLPGSRLGELKYLADDFIATAKWLQARIPDLQIVTPVVSERVKQRFVEALTAADMQDSIQVVDNKARDVMAAADVILLASGTAALEAALVKRPMVAAYRVAPLTHWILIERGVVKIKRYTLPNLLAADQGKPDIIAEIKQDDVTPDIMGPQLLALFQDEQAAQTMTTALTELHPLLRKDASKTAAKVVAELMDN